MSSTCLSFHHVQRGLLTVPMTACQQRPVSREHQYNNYIQSQTKSTDWQLWQLRTFHAFSSRFIGCIVSALYTFIAPCKLFIITSSYIIIRLVSYHSSSRRDALLHFQLEQTWLRQSGTLCSVFQGSPWQSNEPSAKKNNSKNVIVLSRHQFISHTLSNSCLIFVWKELGLSLLVRGRSSS
jgi:hypothetical protein